MSLDALEMKLGELEESMLTAHPSMPGILQDIHSQLQRDPDNVTLLSEEQIATVVNGLQLQTKVELIAAAPKKKTKSLKSASVDDI